MNPSEENEKKNQFRKEAHSQGIVGPFRQMLYVKARINGASKETALKTALKKP